MSSTVVEKEKKCSDNFPSVCRVCLNSSLNNEYLQFTSLFDPYRDSTASAYIISITNINIRIDDNLPDKICAACLVDLSTLLDFIVRCHNSNKSLLIARSNVCKNETKVEIKSENQDHELASYSPAFQDTDFPDPDLNEEKTQIKNELSLALLIDSSRSFFEIKPMERKKRVAKKKKLRMKSQVLEERFECHDCNEIFKTKCKLRFHRKKVHSTLSYKCHRCKRMFKSQAAYEKHIESKPSNCLVTGNAIIHGEGKSRIFGCTRCSYNTPSMNSFKLHMRVHTGEKPIKCKICDKRYTQHSVLSCHMESAHGLYKVEITCEFCGKLVRGRDNVYKHLKQHSSARYQCDTCKKFLKSKDNLITHMRRHSGVKSFTCDVCASAFYTLAELTNHKKFHSEWKDWFKCDLCEYRTPQKRTLLRHQPRHSDNNAVCELCGKFFVDAMRLLRHMQMHAEGKKFSCQLCIAKYSDRDNLIKHVKKKHKNDSSNVKTEKKILL